MRILQIDRQRQWAGQQVRTFTLARRLRAAGHEVQFACMPGSGYERHARAEGFPCAVFGMRAGSLVTAVPRLARVLRRERIEVIDAHGSVDHNIALFAAKILGKAVVVRTKHNHTHLHGRLSRLTYGRMTRRIIAVSDFARRTLLEDGIAEARIDLVPDGIDTAAIAAGVAGQDRAAARRRFGIPEGAFAVGTTSRPSPRKGIDVAANAVMTARARAGGAGAPIVYVACGGKRDVIQHHAQDVGGIHDEALITPGFLERVHDIFPALDVFLLPSREEALGMALLEAMAAGSAVCASSVGGIPEVVRDGESGLLVPPGDSDALAAAILRIRDDPALARRLGEGARAVVRERHDIAGMTEKTRLCYERALS